MSDRGRATSDNKYVYSKDIIKISLANIRDWNISNICLFFLLLCIERHFISSGGHFIVNKGVLRYPAVSCGVLR